MTADLRIGGLFEGYGGLTAGVQAAVGGELAWYSEIDPAASRILTHHHPDVPNLGDITAVDWSAVEPVDVLTGGFPCQDVSAAGKRAGHVTAVPGLTRNEMLKALGNGVVPAQAAAAVRFLLPLLAGVAGSAAA